MRPHAALLVLTLAACGGESQPDEAPVARAAAAKPASAKTSRAGTEAKHAATGALFRGRTFAQWLGDLSGEDESARAAAAAVLRDAGDAGVDALMEWLFDEDRAFADDSGAVGLLAERRDVVVPLVLARLDHAPGAEHDGAAYALLTSIALSGGFGANAPAVVESMLRRTGDESAIALIGMCGAAAERAVPALSALLANDADLKYVLAALTSLGPHAKAALPSLSALAADYAKRDSPGLGDVLRVIATFGADAKDAVPLAVSAVRSSVESVRSAGVRTLVEVGVVDDAVVGALVAAAWDKEESVSAPAIAALGRIGVRTPAYLDALASACRAREFASEDQAAALAKLATGDAAAADVLTRVIADHGSLADDIPWDAYSAVEKDPEVRAVVVPRLVEMAKRGRVGALECLTWLDEPAARELGRALLPGASGDLRLVILDCLAVGGAADAPTLAPLVAAVQGDDTDAALRALWDIGCIGTSAASAAPAIRTRLDDARSRPAALMALARIGVHDERVLSLALAALAAEKPGDRADAVRTIAYLGEDGRAAAPRLADVLRDDPDDGVKQHAIDALAALGVLDPIVDAIRTGALGSSALLDAFAEVPSARVDAVCGYAADANATVRRAVVRRLGKERGVRIETQLAVLLRDEFSSVREDAADALAEFDALSSSAVDALRVAAQDATASVAIAAARALGKPGRDPAAAARALFDVLATTSAYELEAGSALADLGRGAAAVAPDLVRLLRPSLHCEKARWALRLLGNFPAETRAAAPELAAIAAGRVRDTRDPLAPDCVESRALAARLLGDVGGEAAVAALRDARLDPARDVREAAAASLAKLGAR